MKIIVFGILFALSFVSVFMGAFSVHSAKANASSHGETAQATGTAWWPMFRHDLNRTGASTSTAPTTNKTLWICTRWAGDSSPAVVDGRVYVAADDDNVYCLNAATGALVWNHTLYDTAFSPAVVGGRVYVGSLDGKEYCLNAANGALVWTYKTGGYVNSSPAVVGSVVYFGSWDRKVYCLNAANGAFIWSYTTGAAVLSAPAVVGSRVYVGSDYNVYCLNAANGAFIWSYTTGGLMKGSSPAVVGSLVYVGSEDDYVYCLNAANGSLVWRYWTSGWVDSSPAVVGGRVYVASSYGTVYCLNAANGSLVWSWTKGYYATYSSPAVAGGLVYVGSNDFSVYCLNAATGSLVWSYKTGYVVFSSPAVADGVVYVGSEDDNIYAFGSSPPLTVSISPTSVTVDIGQSNLFTSTVSYGTSPCTYQWYLNGASVSGATGATWTFTPSSSGSYTVYVNVTDNFGVEAQSNTASVTAHVATLSVSISPTSVTMDIGQSQTFSSAVSGGISPYTYQWYLNGTHVSGATGSTWTFTSSSRGSYTVYTNVIDNIGVTANSYVATITVNPRAEFPLYLILLLVIITGLLLAILAVFVLRRKRNARTQ